MNEKIYKTMSRTGACSIAVGIITLVTGVAAGVLMIVSGSRLLKRKSDISDLKLDRGKIERQYKT